MTTNEGNGVMNGCGKGLIAGGLIVAGGLIGVALGILYAPKSGKEMRAEISHSAMGLVNRAKDQCQGTYQKMEKLANCAKESFVGEKRS